MGNEQAMNGEDRSSAGAKDEEHRPHLHPRPGEHWEHHPRPKEGDLDAQLPDAKTPDSKADALSAAQKGDHCVLVRAAAYSPSRRECMQQPARAPLPVSQH